MSEKTGTAQIGVVGMAVMGSNLARNFASKGYKVAIHNRSAAKTEKVIAEHGDDGEFYPSETMADFVASLSKPRVAIIMVKAGDAVDQQIAALKPLLAPNVMDSFEVGIAAREVRGETEQVEFLHAPRADIESATVEGDKAVAKVRFLAELRSKIARTDAPTEAEPQIEERRTAEHWTFERTLGASDPNWVLARVEPANA